MICGKCELFIQNIGIRPAIKNTIRCTPNLNENRLYPSLTYFYLRTTCINSEEDEQTSAQVNSNFQLKESEAAHIVNQVIGLTPDTQYSSEATASTASFPSGETVTYFSHPEFRTVCLICCCTNLPDEECLRCKQDEEFSASLFADEVKVSEDATRG